MGTTKQWGDMYLLLRMEQPSKVSPSVSQSPVGIKPVTPQLAVQHATPRQTASPLALRSQGFAAAQPMFIIKFHLVFLDCHALYWPNHNIQPKLLWKGFFILQCRLVYPTASSDKKWSLKEILSVFKIDRLKAKLPNKKQSRYRGKRLGECSNPV